MKGSVSIILFAALLTFSFSAEKAGWVVDVSSAVAESSSKSSGDSKSSSKSSGDSKSSSKSSEDSTSKSSGGSSKVTICHVTSKSDSSSKSDSTSKSDSSSKSDSTSTSGCSSDASSITITVDSSAWPAHEAHGDSMGACVAPTCMCPPGVCSCTCADGGPGEPDAGSPTPTSSSVPASSSSHREIMGQ